MNNSGVDTIGVIAQRVWEPMVQYWISGGWPLVPLAFVALLMFYRYFVLYSRLKKALSTPTGTISELEHEFGEGASTDVVRAEVEELPGALARITRHALARVSRGMSFNDAYDQCREAEISRFNGSFLVLAGLVGAAPLLGLLGTVLGMVETFTAVGESSVNTADQVASGISKALITTQVGLATALPGTFGLAHLRRLMNRLRNEMDHWESHLSVYLQHR